MFHDANEIEIISSCSDDEEIHEDIDSLNYINYVESNDYKANQNQFHTDIVIKPPIQEIDKYTDGDLFTHNIYSINNTTPEINYEFDFIEKEIENEKKILKKDKKRKYSFYEICSLSNVNLSDECCSDKNSFDKQIMKCFNNVNMTNRHKPDLHSYKQTYNVRETGDNKKNDDVSCISMQSVQQLYQNLYLPVLVCSIGAIITGSAFVKV